MQRKIHNQSGRLPARVRFRGTIALAALLLLQMTGISLANPVRTTTEVDFIWMFYMDLLPVAGILLLAWIVLLFRKNEYFTMQDRIGILVMILAGAALCGLLVGVIFLVIALIRLIKIATGKPPANIAKDQAFAKHTEKRNKNSDFIAQLEKMQEADQ